MRNDVLAFEDLSKQVRYALLGMALVAVVGNYLFIKVVQIAGSVFASQCGYIIMFAGVGWAYLLLQEQLNSGTLLALCLMIIGLLLVEPKREPDEVLNVGVYDS
jgi:drug/metabolite transporter (DMT)-like permease